MSNTNFYTACIDSHIPISPSSKLLLQTYLDYLHLACSALLLLSLAKLSAERTDRRIFSRQDEDDAKMNDAKDMIPDWRIDLTRKNIDKHKWLSPFLACACYLPSKYLEEPSIPAKNNDYLYKQFEACKK